LSLNTYWVQDLVSCLLGFIAVICSFFQIFHPLEVHFTVEKMQSMSFASMSTSSSLQSLDLDLNYEFVNLDPKYKCIRCDAWLKFPMQIPCGHRMCRSCVDGLFASNAGTQGFPCPSGEEGCEKFTRDKVWIYYSWYKQAFHCGCSTVYGHFGSKTLWTQDISALVS